VSLFKLKSICKLFTEGNSFSPKIAEEFKGMAICAFSEVIIFILAELFLYFVQDFFLYAGTIIPMIVVNLDVMMAKRKMSLTELSQKLGMTMANVSNFKNQKAKAFRFTTLDALCKILQCQPGDILEYREDI
jgi:putative transcriptional regulator